MSSFSSVVRKPGKKIVPKAGPRRNVQRRNSAVSSNFSDAQIEQDAGLPLEGSAPSGGSISAASVSLVESTPQDASTTSSQDPSTIQTSSAQSAELLTASSRNRAARAQNDIRTTFIRTDDTADHEIPGRRGIKRKAAHLQEHDTSSAVIQTMEATSGLLDGEMVIPANSSQSSATSISNGIRRTTRQTPAQSSAIVGSTSERSPILQRNSSNFQESLVGNRRSETPAELLQSATSQAASVSDLANSLDSETRARNERLQATRGGINHDYSADPETSTSDLTTSGTRPRQRTKKTAKEKALEVVDRAASNGDGGKRRRADTPEDAEDHRIDEKQITMGELVRDNKLGRKSVLEKEMSEKWPEILQRRKEERERLVENAQRRRRRARNQDLDQGPTEQVTVQTVVRNGIIVTVEASRQVDRTAQAEQAVIEDQSNVLEDRDYYKNVNQATVGMKASYGKRFRWDEETTEKFFKALQMFGTDFMMIANMFPGLDRKQVKMKFIREENADKAKVMEHLANRIPVDLEEYGQTANIEFQDPKTIEEEIKAEEERILEEDRQRRLTAGYGQAPATDVVESVETGNEASTTEGPARFAKQAEEILRASKSRKNPTATRKRSQRATQAAEGVEQELGSIDEVAR